jgi:hypothetical protein
VSEGGGSAGAGEESDTDDGEPTVVAKARVQFDFTPTTSKQLELKAGDLVDVLDNLSLWWVVRRSDGKDGLVRCHLGLLLSHCLVPAATHVVLLPTMNFTAHHESAGTI